MFLLSFQMFHEVHPGCTFLELYSFFDQFFPKATQKSIAFAPQTPSSFFLRAFRSNHLFRLDNSCDK